MTVTQSKLKTFAKVAGISAVPVGLLLIIYLVSMNLITITSHSGDMACAGTVSDPCYAFINFTVNNATTIGKLDDNGLFKTDKKLKDVKIYNLVTNKTKIVTKINGKSVTSYKYSSSWTELNFSKSNSLQKGLNYSWMIVAYKNNPSDTVKWSFGKLDPIWYPSADIIKYCYQESANETNQSGTDTNCALKYSGSYSESGDYVYINYTKPSTADSALWQVKHGNSSQNTPYNATIPASCFNYYPQTLSLRIYAVEGTSYGDCFNGTWNTITSNFTEPVIIESHTANGIYKMYDGDWSTSTFKWDALTWSNCNFGDCMTGRFYEEAMNWHVDFIGLKESENLNFTGNQNITRYLFIDRYADINSAYMNLTGIFTGLNEINANNGCSGVCGNIVDGDWNTWYDAQGPWNTYINYTKPAGANYAYYKLKYQTVGVSYGCYFNYTCWDGSQWLLVKQLPEAYGTIDYTQIPEACLTSSILQTRIISVHNGIYSSNALWEQNITWINNSVSNPYLQIGDGTPTNENLSLINYNYNYTSSAVSGIISSDDFNKYINSSVPKKWADFDFDGNGNQQIYFDLKLAEGDYPVLFRQSYASLMINQDNWDWIVTNLSVYNYSTSKYEQVYYLNDTSLTTCSIKTFNVNLSSNYFSSGKVKFLLTMQEHDSYPFSSTTSGGLSCDGYAYSRYAIINFTANVPLQSHPWDYNGAYGGITQRTSDFSDILNPILQNGCSCTDCALDGNNCSISFVFHSDTAGILNYSDINIDYKYITSNITQSPANETSYSLFNNTFQCNSTTTGKELENMTIYIYKDADLVYNSTNNITGTSNSTIFSVNLVSGNYTWFCTDGMGTGPLYTLYNIENVFIGYTNSSARFIFRNNKINASQPDGQTDEQGFYNITNFNIENIAVYVSLNYTVPQIVMKAGNSSDYNNSIIIDTTNKTVLNLQAGGMNYIWFWADFNNYSGAGFRYAPRLDINYTI